MSSNKSFSTETSERYSRALYEVGKEAEEVEKIESDINNFLSLFNNSSEIKNFFQNPTHTTETQNKVLIILSQKLSFSKNLQNFFLLLIEKRRIFFIKKILDSFLIKNILLFLINNKKKFFTFLEKLNFSDNKLNISF